MSAADVWLGSRFPEFSARDFYRYLFPSGCLDARGAFTKGRYCAIAVAVSDNQEGRKVRRYTVCDDLDPIEEIVLSDDFVVISPVAYAGKRMSQENARELYALAFDLDGLITEGGRQVGLENLFASLDDDETAMPRPTFVVSSGTGVHLYWMLDKPIRLFSDTLKALWKFRIELTRAIWQPSVTDLSANPQFESVTQSFRAVGSLAKDKKTRVKAFKTGKRLSLDTLRDIASGLLGIEIPAKYKNTMSLSEAKERYPEWYEERIVAGKPRGTWTCDRALYDWWKRQVIEGNNCLIAGKYINKDKGAQVGHRYWSIFALAVYARKCDIPREELEKDALAFIDVLDERTTSPDNHFTVSDVMKALEAYDARYITVPRSYIQQMTNIDIPPNKRNGRTRQQQMAIVNASNAVKRSFGDNLGAGQPSKRGLVVEWYSEHPDTTVRECAQALGISTRTAQKWLHELRQR